MVCRHQAAALPLTLGVRFCDSAFMLCYSINSVIIPRGSRAKFEKLLDSPLHRKIIIVELHKN